MEILSKQYGLHSSVQLKQIANNHIGIIKNIKSRIIQKDALKIIEIATTIQTKKAGTKVSLFCNDNICSKSLKLLNANGIAIQFL